MINMDSTGLEPIAVQTLAATIIWLQRSKMQPNPDKGSL